MEREVGSMRQVDILSTADSDNKTLSPLLFQQLRSKFGIDIEFQAETPALNDILQLAASSKKTSTTKEKSSSIAYNRFSRAYNRFSRAYNRFSR